MYVKLVRPKTRPSRVLGYRIVGKTSPDTFKQIIGIYREHDLWYSKGMYAWVRTLHDEDALPSLYQVSRKLRKAGIAVNDGELEIWLEEILRDPAGEYYRSAMGYQGLLLTGMI